MSHTPTPWMFDKANWCTWIFRPDEKRQGHMKTITKIEHTCCDVEAQANAAFIVEACNAHERLKSALLKIATEILEEQACRCDWQETEGLCLHCKAKQALALCEEGGK